MSPGLDAQQLTDPNLRARLASLLAAPRYEVLPLDGVVDDAAAHLPEGATVTVTASPARGPEATLTTAADLSRRGFHAVPHLAARQYSADTLAPALQRLQAAGVGEVFVVGGDDDGAAGPSPAHTADLRFGDGETLLNAVRQASPEVSIGVPGYPEGHPAIPDQVLQDSLRRKLDQAHRVVSQLCFDSGPVGQWAQRIRTLAPAQSEPAQPEAAQPQAAPSDAVSQITVPVYAGVAGAVGMVRLLRIGSRIGVGDSLRFLKSGAAAMRRLATPGRYDPTRLVTDLAAAEDQAAVDGLHLYTFNALEQTEQWRLRLLARLKEAEPR